jgi:hypothetical protein
MAKKMTKAESQLYVLGAIVLAFVYVVSIVFELIKSVVITIYEIAIGGYNPVIISILLCAYLVFTLYKKYSSKSSDYRLPIFMYSKSKREIINLLNEIEQGDQWSDDTVSKIKSAKEEFGVSNSFYKLHLAKTFNRLFSQYSKDEMISNQQKERLESFANLFGLSSGDISFKQELFNVYHTLWMLENKIMPTFKSDLNFKLSENESIRWAQQSSLIKVKQVRGSYQYHGITFRLNLGAGFRYRAGSIRIGANVKEVFNVEDSGLVWISDDRVGFDGPKLKVQIKLKDIHSIELGDNNYLLIFKRGRETPYMIYINDPRVVVSLLHFLVFEPGELREVS